MDRERTKTAKSPPIIGPYSRRLRRGVLADSLDGRSTLGRFVRDLEAQLVEHCGGSPSITQRMLIERAVKIRVQLDLLDKKLTAGDWTPHDGRTYGSLLNAHRLCVRELGLRPQPPPAPTLSEHFASIAAARDAGGA